MVCMDQIKSGVYRIIKEIPSGRVSTYKEVARSLGIKNYRLIGRALALNPYAPIVPCHRIVLTDGRLGGYSGPGGASGKIRLLKKEGVPVRKGRIKDFEKYFFSLNV